MSEQKIRVLLAKPGLDGHDRGVKVIARALRDAGMEVIYTGLRQTPEQIVNAALQEDVQGVAITSYQGGHVEYFKYMIDLLKQRGGAHIKVFGGGGGVIVPAETADLHAYGVTRIFSPEDGQRMGLVGMICSMVQACDQDLSGYAPTSLGVLHEGEIEQRHRPLAQLITALENDKVAPALRDDL